MRSYSRYWAKADRESPDSGRRRSFPDHVAAVVACAEEMCRARPLLKSRVAALLGCSEEEALRFILVSAAFHDLGKLCVLFQLKNLEGFRATYGHGEVTRFKPGNRDALASRPWYHGTDGYLLLLAREHIESRLPDSVIRAILPGTWHHGSCHRPGTQEEAQVRRWWRSKRGTPEGQLDTQAAEDFADDVLQVHGTPDLSTPIPGRDWADSQTEGLQLVAGVVAVADWLGSDEQHFALDLSGRSYASALAAARASAAEHVRQIFPPWPTRRGWFTPETPNATQRAVRGAAGRLVIIEAPTGEGKTNAAFILFDELLEAGKVDRVVQGLPTRAMSTAMHRRLLREFKRCFGVDNLPLLHHGSSAEARLTGGAEDEERAEDFGHRWLQTGKRAMLARASVVTIDQILMTVLRGHRHQFVRQLGLSTAFVIIDEVHEVDAYMEGILGDALEVLGRSGAHVALLSATLTAATRNRLLARFAAGMGVAHSTPISSGRSQVTTLRADGVVSVVPVEGIEPRKAEIRAWVHGWDGRRPALADVERVALHLAEEARSGKCVGWLRNTVEDAQILLGVLRRVAPDVETLSLNASLARPHRDAAERALVDMLGPSGARRPVVVVGTSLVGMSLDVDFDRLVIDLATLDRVLQALGRVHRHGAPRPGFLLEVFLPDEMGDWNLYDATHEEERVPLFRTWQRLRAGGVLSDLYAEMEAVFSGPTPIESDPAYSRWLKDQAVLEKRRQQCAAAYAARHGGVPTDGPRAPTRLGRSLAILVLLDVEGAAVRASGSGNDLLDVSPLLHLDQDAAARSRWGSCRGVWDALGEVVRTAGVTRSTFPADSTTCAPSDDVGGRLTALWASAKAHPSGVVFVTAEGGAAAVVRTAAGRRENYEVRYDAHKGLVTERF